MGSSPFAVDLGKAQDVQAQAALAEGGMIQECLRHIHTQEGSVAMMKGADIGEVPGSVGIQSWSTETTAFTACTTSSTGIHSMSGLLEP